MAGLLAQTAHNAVPQVRVSWSYCHAVSVSTGQAKGSRALEREALRAVGRSVVVLYTTRPVRESCFSCLSTLCLK